MPMMRTASITATCPTEPGPVAVCGPRGSLCVTRDGLVLSSVVREAMSHLSVTVEERGRVTNLRQLRHDFQ